MSLASQKKPRLGAGPEGVAERGGHFCDIGDGASAAVARVCAQVVKPVQRPKKMTTIQNSSDSPPARRAGNGGGS